MAKSISDLLQIFRSSVSAVLPENLIRNCVKYNHALNRLALCNENYDLDKKNLYLIGAGKAVQSMAREVETILAPKIKDGVISIPKDSLKMSSFHNVIYCEGAKDNLPDIDSVDTSQKIEKLVSKLGSDDLLIVLISGGGSALLTLPKHPITLAEKTELIKNLSNLGADIKELNTVRKKLSEIKGGQLAIKSQPAQIVTLILSDIVGDPIDLIASGPTVENFDHDAKALQIVQKYNIYNELPSSIQKVLNESANRKPFPKDNVNNFVIGSNKLSIEAAVKTTEVLNYYPIPLSSTVTGDLNLIAKEYVKLTAIITAYMDGNINMLDMKNAVNTLRIPGVNTDVISDNLELNKDVCIVLGGEITVKVMGKGKGGRNQQLALEFSKHIEEIKQKIQGFEVHILSAGTDGIDGPTDAAGAIGYSGLIPDAKKLDLNVDEFLENSDSYNFYKQFRNGDLHVITGHTNTNVMDVHLILIKRIIKS